MDGLNFDEAWLRRYFSGIEFFFIAVGLKNINVLMKLGDYPDFHLICNGDAVCVSSRSPEHGVGLAKLESQNIFLFRGYELDQGVVSYRDRIGDDQANRLENGIFSFVKVCSESKLIRIRTDAFGISPIFYKQHDGIVLISSHNVLLRSADDKIDPVGELSMLNIGYSFGEYSVLSNIKRVPPGSDFLIGPNENRVVPWIDYASLGSGTRFVGDDAAQEVEASFKAAMNRCLKLSYKPLRLPLSSGYDSRRIFGYLNQSGCEFETITAKAYKILRGEYYDIDGTFAPKIAQKFGIANKLVNAATPEELVTDLAYRDTLLGSESLMHGWSFRLRHELSGMAPSCIFDGLGGDALGNSGFVFAGFHDDYSRNAEILHRETSNSGIAAALDFPELVVQDYLNKYWDYLDGFPKNPNQCEIAFMLLRTRRSISPWILMTQSPRHLIFFPYLDLNHVRKTFEFQPGEKYRVFFQRDCLKRFYPDYFDIPGSRAMPSVLRPLPVFQRQQLADYERSYLFSPKVIEKISKRVGKTNKMLFSVNKLFWPVSSPRAWLFELLARYYRSEERQDYFIN